MELTEDDVLEILKLFEQSKFDFLQLQQGERKITVSKGGYVPAQTAPPAATPSAPASGPQPSSPQVSAPPLSIPPPDAAAPSEVPEGLVPVTAPMVGRFYAAASPSDPPYVEEGTAVSVGATVGLIEVMKVFTSIKSEIAGVIEKILVMNGQYVEFGQTLFLIRPDAAAKN